MAFKRIATPDKNLQLLQDNIANGLATNSAMANGTVLGSLQKPISLASGSNIIPHGLKRVPQYWAILDVNAAATIYRTASDATNITLQASQACSVILWVN